MLIDTVLFYIFAVLVLGGGILTITQRNAVHCAVALIVSLSGVAGLYLLQQAEFLFAVQIVLYVGGIMLLFLFVIMLVNLDHAAKERQFNRQWLVALIAVAAVGAQISYFLYHGKDKFRFADVAAALPIEGGNTEAIATSLFQTYLLPFEIASILLLVAGGGLGGHGEEEDLMHPITTTHYLALSAALLLIGTVGVLTRRNIVIILMSIELILNAVNINLIAFSHVLKDISGQVFAIFVITDAVPKPPWGWAF